jgi:Helix-turn-helix domain
VSHRPPFGLHPESSACFTPGFSAWPISRSPRISNLARGQIDLFSIDTLVDMLAAVGVGVKLSVGRRSQVA